MLTTIGKILGATAHRLFRPSRAGSSVSTSGGAVWTIPPQVRVSVQGDGLALLEISRGRVFTCNRTGRHVWEGLAAGRTPAAIAAELGRDYALPEERIQRHVAEFVAELVRYRLLAGRAEC